VSGPWSCAVQRREAGGAKQNATDSRRLAVSFGGASHQRTAVDDATQKELRSESATQGTTRRKQENKATNDDPKQAKNNAQQSKHKQKETTRIQTTFSTKSQQHHAGHLSVPNEAQIGDE